MRRGLMGPIGLAGLLVTGCTAGPIEPPDWVPAEIGTLHISVVGGERSWASLGTGWVAPAGDGSGTPTAFNVPSTGIVALNLAAGAYDVRYAAPVGYRATGSSAEPTRVSVATGAQAFLAFQLLPVTSISIVVNGLSAARTGSGGVVTIVRTDVTPNVTVVVPVREDGLAFVAVMEAPPGSYSVSYRPPARFELHTGDPNPKTGVLTDGRMTHFSFRVVPTGKGPS